MRRSRSHARSHLNLRGKLTLAFALELAVVGAVVAVALVGLSSVKGSFQSAIEHGLLVERLADDLKSALYEARSFDQSFMLSWRSHGFEAARDEFLPRHRAQITTMGRLIAQLEQQPSTGLGGADRRMREDLVALKPYVNVYAEDFQAVVALIGERSARDPALEPAFRKLVSALFTGVENHRTLDALWTMLYEMRRREKDHLLRGEAAAADDVRALGLTLDERIARLPDLGPGPKGQLRSLLAAYQRIFDEIARLEARIVDKKAAYQLAATVVQPLVTDIAMIGRRYAVDEVDAAQAAAGRTVFSVGAALTLAVLLGLGLSYLLGRHITTPLRSLARTAEAIGRGALDVQAPVTTEDEIGTLAVAFNSMTGRLRALVESLQQRVHERERAEDLVRQLNAELEDRVRQRTAALEAANRELEAFSYSVCHDLRTPLRHIGSFAGLLGESEAALGSTGRQHLNVIREAVSGMGHLIDSLLAFSQFSRAELRTVDIDLAQLVDEVKASLSAEIGDRPIVWRVGKLPCLRGDRLLMRQVLINLLSNAIKFTRPRTPAQIEVGPAPEQGGPSEAVFFVRDNGVGFDMAYGHKLFRVFKRLHRREEFDGIGIGLANVERIVNRHGGRIWAESVVQQGATFYVALPRPLSPPA